MATGLRWSRKRINAAATVGLMFATICFLLTAWDQTVTGDIDGRTDRNTRSKTMFRSTMKINVMTQQHPDVGYRYPDVDEIQLVMAVCGNRISEAKVNLKSAVMFTKARIHLHIFIEDNLKEPLLEDLNSWPDVYKMKITLTFYSISYPSHVGKDFRNVYAPCSTQRIFFPDLLPELDAIMYVDTDVLFIRPLDDHWRLLRQFNSTQIASMVPALPGPGCPDPVYKKGSTKIPLSGDFGMNSGVMLMNLTRMRSISLTYRLMDIYKEYKTVFEYGDQDMFNIFFHYNPERLYVASCKWNWRKYGCAYTPGVNSCDDGIAILHGTEQTFHTEENPPFRAVYEAFKNFALGADIKTGLIDDILKRLSLPNVASQNCTHVLSTELVSTLRLNNDKPLLT